MRLIIGNVERETRRGSYWTVPVIVTSEPDALEWHSDVVAVAQGETPGQAKRRAIFIRNALMMADDAMRSHLGVGL
jgi:hypothetical protein